MVEVGVAWRGRKGGVWEGGGGGDDVYLNPCTCSSNRYSIPFVRDGSGN